MYSHTNIVADTINRHNFIER